MLIYQWWLIITGKYQLAVCDVTVFIFQPHFWKFQPPLMGLIYVSSWLDIPGESEYRHRISKFFLQLMIWWYFCFSHISGNFNLHQWGWSIHHPDHFFQETLNLVTEFLNSICGQWYGNICISATSQEIWTFTNQNDLYIMLTEFPRRAHMWSQNFKISSVAHNMAIFVVATFQQLIRMTYIICIRFWRRVSTTSHPPYNIHTWHIYTEYIFQ